MNQFCIKCGDKTTQQAVNLYVCGQGHQNWINAVPGATVFILNEDARVLYGVRSIEPHKGKMNLPGGFLDLGESAEQAAIREVREELGIDIEIIDFIGSYSDDYSGRPTLNIMFVARQVGGTIAPAEDLGGGDIVWRSIDDLPLRGEVGWEWYMPAQADLAAWWARSRQ